MTNLKSIPMLLRTRHLSDTIDRRITIYFQPKGIFWFACLFNIPNACLVAGCVGTMCQNDSLAHPLLSSKLLDGRLVTHWHFRRKFKIVNKFNQWLFEVYTNNSVWWPSFLRTPSYNLNRLDVNSQSYPCLKLSKFSYFWRIYSQV